MSPNPSESPSTKSAHLSLRFPALAGWKKSMLDELLANDDWIVEAGSVVLEKAARHEELDQKERFLRCFWTIDYGLRNAGELEQAEDVRPGVIAEARELAAKLGLRKCSALLEMPPSMLEEHYEALFDSICTEVRQLFVSGQTPI